MSLSIGTTGTISIRFVKTTSHEDLKNFHVFKPAERGYESVSRLKELRHG